MICFRISCIFFIFFFSLNINSQDSNKVDLTYIGSSTIGNFIKDSEELGRYNFEIDTKPESSGGELAILEGRTDLAGIARVPSKDLLSSGVTSTLIGWDAIAIIIHPDNPIHNLTKSQLKAIYTGEVRNWSVYGGPDLVINPYIVGPESATRNVCRSIILGLEDYHDCEDVRPDNDIIEKVKNDPGGIGQISFSFVQDIESIKVLQINGQVLTLSNTNYPITRPLYLLWWPERKDVARFVNWAKSSDGQQIVRLRFVGIKEAPIQNDESFGELLVYTKTNPVEDGGIFYYPHEPYDVLHTDGTLILRVQNHLSKNDESPARIKLPPGNYIVRTNLKSSQLKEFSINIKNGQITRIYAEQNESSIDRKSTNDGSGQASILNREKNQNNNQLFNFFGDFRVRTEQDFREVEDRFRGRFRIRAGMFASLNPDTKIEFRIVSTGDVDDPNSSHVDLDDGFNQIKVAIDRAYLHYKPQKRTNFEWWLGKFSNPNISSQIFSELVWDADIQPEGTAFLLKKSPNTKIENLRLINGTYLLSNFKKGTRKNWLNTTQASAEIRFSPDWNLTLASGLYYFFNIKDLETTSPVLDRNEGNAIYTSEEIIDGDTTLVNRYLSDFYVFDNFTFLKSTSFKSPLIIKFQWVSNLGAKDENTGYSIGASYGELKEKNQWLFYYQYNNFQRDAVFTPFVQDDTLEKTNTSGHVFGIARSFHKKISAHFWALINNSKDVETQTVSRFRLDLNVKI